LPPFAEQRRIAANINEYFSETFKARAALQHQLDLINQLPAAILRRAFSGGL